MDIKEFIDQYKKELLSLENTVLAMYTAVGDKILADLSKANTEYKKWILTEQIKNLAVNIAILKGDIQKKAGASTDYVVRSSNEMIDAMLRERGIFGIDNVVASTSIKEFVNSKIKEVSDDNKNRITAQLNFYIVGGNTFADTLDSVSNILNANRNRALTIVRTEASRAFNTANQDKLALAGKRLNVKPKKEWLSSGKLYPRQTHLAAHGQRVDFDKPFDVGGFKLMYPHDPSAPASEVINCGCTSIPIIE
jgi:hypothetical protein